MYDDYYEMYLEELEQINRCSEQEMTALLEAKKQGDQEARTRLIEGHLYRAAACAKEYADRGLPLSDLVQEANIALTLAVNRWQDEDFEAFIVQQIREALQMALEEEKQADLTGEELTARVNVLKDIAQDMAVELGREASLAELADRMKMTEEDIKGIMKMTLDAMGS